VSDAPIVEARDLHVTFEDKRGRRHAPPARAVDGVDLAITPGEIVALVGESGCGKTTLARTLLGLELPTGGQVIFRGTPLSRRTRDLRAYRKHVQIVFQDPTGALNPRQTIYESVAEGLRIHKVLGNERDLVAGALSRSGLRPPERFFQRYPHEISGGQRQRVVIAGAIALEPALIVADEPVASLDASVRGEILSLMLGLVQQTQVAMLVVTHDLGLAWNIADRIAVMYLGRIVELGTTEEVLDDPQHPYTRALLSVVPEIEHMAPEILSGEPPDPTNIPDGCRFHPRCPVVTSGRAEELGIVTRCRTDDPTRIPIGPGHRAACHAADRAVTTSAEPAG
jgi:oligopeptide/dipeptide ABC transporter ATP-binding protein